MRAVLRPMQQPAPAVAAAIVLVLACGGAGVLLGRSLGGSDARDPEAQDLGRTATSGALRLQLPAEWSRVAKPPTLPGFATRDPIAARLKSLRIGLVAALLPADHESLLPAALLRRLEAPPRPTMVLLADGTHAYQYLGLSVQGRDEIIDAYVLPTADGVATVACVVRAADAPFLSRCDEVARTMSVEPDRRLPLGPAAALRSRLPSVLATLDAVRNRYGQAATRGSSGAANQLATAHRHAGETLSRVAVAAGRPSLAQALRDEGLAYSRLGDALSRRDRPSAIRERTRIKAVESRLRRELDCIRSERATAATCGVGGRAP